MSAYECIIAIARAPAGLLNSAPPLRETQERLFNGIRRTPIRIRRGLRGNAVKFLRATSN